MENLDARIQCIGEKIAVEHLIRIKRKGIKGKLGGKRRKGDINIKVNWVFTYGRKVYYTGTY